MMNDVSSEQKSVVPSLELDFTLSTPLDLYDPEDARLGVGASEGDEATVQAGDAVSVIFGGAACKVYAAGQESSG